MSVEVFPVPQWWKPAIQVGGQEASQHLIATAWDIAGPDQYTYAARARKVGLTVLDEGDHIHVQLFRPGVVPQSVYDQVARA